MKDGRRHLLTWHASSTMTVSKPLPDELTVSTRGPDPHPDNVAQITCDKKTRASVVVNKVLCCNFTGILPATW